MATDRQAAHRRQLGAELRRLREASGKTIEATAGHLECSSAKVCRIENGHVAVHPRDLHAMLGLYGVTGARGAALLALVRQSRDKSGWWHTYADVIAEGDEFFLSLEKEAAIICDYQPFLMPALLQSEAYMHAVIDAGAPPAVEDQRAALRHHRQSIVTGDRPRQLHVLLEEGVLHRPVGTSGVMREQLQHLLDMGARPGVRLQVLETSVGHHAAEGRAFTLLGFPDPDEPKVVYLELFNDSCLLDDPGKTAGYGRVFSFLQDIALSPSESASLIKTLLVGSLA
ncbi:helix-turn-helix domain-containing protein [Nonomuraea sp. SYSU D8015]|uniref:helix-turn-helix domain-containing protein n=1 Tax=Nonomuraea sp. SYSU D8015 TaxID=2593644 RepID=UPI0016609D8B|nr:helix-turn-helix transcriptional regulator [Nonomuraea sp. SYSU D8015]